MVQYTISTRVDADVLKVFWSYCSEVGFIKVPRNNKSFTWVRGFLLAYIPISGGPLSALTCCVNVRLLSAIKKISPLIYSQSWVASWVYTTQAMMTFTLIF